MAGEFQPPSIRDAPRPLAKDLAIGRPQAGWRALVESPLVVLVGLSGVGKTTLARALSAHGLTPLPERRVLTDVVILPGFKDPSDAMGREARFAATARFREAAPGGMADVLAALSTPDDGRVRLFDGLRGAAEVTAFAIVAPGARFIALDADDATRAERIAGRAEAFDGVAPAAQSDEDGGADLRAARARAEAVVRVEAIHYDAAAAIAALRRHAAGRSLILNVTRLSPDETFAAAAEFLAIENAGFR